MVWRWDDRTQVICSSNSTAVEMSCIRAKPATLDSIARQEFRARWRTPTNTNAYQQEEFESGAGEDIDEALSLLEEAACLNENGTRAMEKRRENNHHCERRKVRILFSTNEQQ